MDEKEKEELLKKIEEYDEAIKLDSNNDSYYNNRGIAFNNLGDFQNAIENYNKAIELNPNNDSYYNNRGIAFKNLEDYDKAISDYSQAINLDPKEAIYYNNRGIAFKNLGDFQNAIENYNKAIELNPNNAFYYKNRGIAFNNLGDFQNAIENYNKAIELNPNNDSAKKLILELKRNEKNESIQQDKKILDATESKGEISKEENSEPTFTSDYNNALDLHLNEKFEDAEKKFSSFINKYKSSPNKSPELENLLTEATSYLIASKFKVKRFIGYLTFADILGWKGIWQKQNTPNGKANYAECLFSIKNSLKNKFNNKQNFYNINLISDTFVIFSKDFKQSNELSKNLIEQCLEKGLLIRGATSYGECYNKDMVYVGQAVDEAASWHEKGEEIGIFYTSSAKLNIKLNDVELEKYFLINDEVNTKIGKIKTYFINWYNETTEKRFYEIMKKEIIYPEISLKYFNTENRLNEILHSEEKEKK